ncbi:MAG: LytTR family DNA-binding domain-containing protein [Cyclobacteriaceae bacterium]
MITTLIVDDEIAAREGLQELLNAQQDFKVVGASRNGDEAVQDIQRLKPDVVFLDIQMPGKNGFEVLKSLPEAMVPYFIFVTAYDEYALEAFRAHALDYLHKPFSNQRFFECLEFIKKQFAKTDNDVSAKLRNLLAEMAEVPTRKDSKLKIKSSGKIYHMDPGEIIWVEGFDYYIKVHTREKFYLVRDSLTHFHSQLPDEFVRIQKSGIVNKNFIHSLEPLSRGNYQVNLSTGKTLTLSKMYKDKYPELLV